MDSFKSQAFSKGFLREIDCPLMIMHKYYDLVYHGTSFTLDVLKELNNKILKVLETSAPTGAVKSLQMIQLQKTVLAIGMFSLFDSILQEQLSCKNGFKEAKRILKSGGALSLYERFEDFICAINVLKHGHGRSHDILLSKSDSLPFILKSTDENFEYEVDVSEISTLIKVDDDFVLNCAELIESVSKEIRKQRPDCFV